MTDKKIYGVPGAMAAVLKNKTKAETDKMVNDSNLAHAKTFNELKVTSSDLKTSLSQTAERGHKAGKAKAEKLSPMKEKATAIYYEMKDKQGKKPSLVQFLGELCKRYPEEKYYVKRGKAGAEIEVKYDWPTDTVKKWLSALNKGKSLN